jgi:hypothetical protein
MACLPFLETKCDKSSYSFRPFRDALDLLKDIKKSFSSKDKQSWYLDIKINCSWNLQTKFWLLKNFPIERQILRSWLNNIVINSFFEYNNSFFYFYSKDIYFILFNYLLNGLL